MFNTDAPATACNAGRPIRLARAGAIRIVAGITLSVGAGPARRVGPVGAPMHTTLTGG
jgi:hypothetical protein